MITEHDLKEAIAECQGIRNPNANTCLKLASYYTIMDHLQTRTPEYSYAPPPNDTITYLSNSKFSQAINGRNADDMWRIIDELMDTLQVIHPRLYDGVMQKIR